MCVSIDTVPNFSPVTLKISENLWGFPYLAVLIMKSYNVYIKLKIEIFTCHPYNLKHTYNSFGLNAYADIECGVQF